jgi:hypothetical protein
MKEGVIVSFYRNPYQTMSSFQEELVRAVSQGSVDGELQIMSGEGKAVESQHFPYEGKVQMQVQGSEEGKMLKIEVQSQEKAGKVLMFKIKGEILDDADIGKVRINFDGKEALKSGNVNEVLEGNSDHCKYYLEKDDDGCYQAMIYVPEFSTHEIEFQVEEDHEDSPMLSLGTAMLIFGSIVVGLGMITYRRKRSD